MKPYLLLFLSLTIWSCGNNGHVKTEKADSLVKTSVPIKTDSLKTRRAINKPTDTLPNIAGYYKELDYEDEPDGCGITVSIKKVPSGYNYYLKTPGKHHRGQATLVRADGDAFGITFNGIKYAEYEGDISNLADTSDFPQHKLPIGITGELQGDTITIQNYGNAMNYYVKIADCGVKYLRLVRTK